jgi:hypothetical protein
VSRDDLVERLANGVLMQSAELRNLAARLEAVCERLHSSTEAQLAVKRELSEMLGAFDGHQHELRAALGRINERLAVIGKDVDDVEKAAREATGAHQLAAHADTKTGMLRAFGELPARTQMLIAVVVVSLPFAGAAAHWLISMLGK